MKKRQKLNNFFYCNHSKDEFLISSLFGLRTNLPSTKPTFAAATGPINGKPDILRAAELAITAKISGSFSHFQNLKKGKSIEYMQCAERKWVYITLT